MANLESLLFFKVFDITLIFCLVFSSLHILLNRIIVNYVINVVTLCLEVAKMYSWHLINQPLKAQDAFF